MCFLLKIDLKFIHTDKYFLGKTDADIDTEHPTLNILSNLDIIKTHILPNIKTLVIMVGAPASGKSTISRYLESKHNYERINRDEMKTEAKMKKCFKDALLAGKIIVIDNTNSTIAARKQWIDEARLINYKVKIFWIKKGTQYLNHQGAQ